MQAMTSEQTPTLSVVVTVVSGCTSLARCLEALEPQINTCGGEVIVPYDKWSTDVAELTGRFPSVRFHRIGDPDASDDPGLSAYQHRLYDRRRAVGLGLARGGIVALTEDHAIPADDWCDRILEVHRQPYAAIGGAIENGVDRLLNWALYYCDFGRYALPLLSRASRYASDVNISYKRAVLESVREVWNDAYHETAVHDALRARGETVFLDPRPVVYQARPAIRFSRALAERIQWGQVFAETRVKGCPLWLRGAYAVGTPLLPWLLAARVVRYMRRHKQPPVKIVMILPIALGLLVGWAVGECMGYVVNPRRRSAPPLAVGPSNAGSGAPARSVFDQASTTQEDRSEAHPSGGWSAPR